MDVVVDKTELKSRSAAETVDEKQHREQSDEPDF
jgi:hypothetical protein